MSQLIQARTNARFALNYETHKLEPEIELIIIFSTPKYNVNKKKSAIEKDIQVQEIRVTTDPEGITKLIGVLQAIQAPINSIGNMAEAFNTIIVNSKDKT